MSRLQKLLSLSEADTQLAKYIVIVTIIYLAVMTVLFALCYRRIAMLGRGKEEKQDSDKKNKKKKKNNTDEEKQNSDHLSP